jgi:hypothetical protein
MLMDRSHLLAEIEFWREMIENNGSAVSAQAMERMRMALALAERKLAQNDKPRTALPGITKRPGSAINQSEIH